MTQDRVLVGEEVGSVTPALIPGIVDGFVTTSFHPDGSVSFHVVIGKYSARASRCDQIELIVRPEHAETLGETLLAERQPHSSATRYGTAAVPCRIGVHLNSHVL